VRYDHRKVRLGPQDNAPNARPHFIRSHLIRAHLDVLDSVAAGTDVVTFDPTSTTTGALKKSSQPIE
jgi:hypothetical protein